MRRRNIDIHILQGLLALSLAGLLLVGIGFARTEARTAPVRVPPPPQFELRLSEAGDSFEFSGRVDFGLTEALRRMVAKHPEVALIRLQSQGGVIAEARGVVRLLGMHRIATRVDAYCASACALMFAGGHLRSLGPEGQLGFHGYALARGQGFGLIDPQAEMKRDLAIYRAQGLDEAFVAKLAELPRQPMWYPDRAELRAVRMLTQP